MPYIEESRRKILDSWDAIERVVPATAGELNYSITSMLMDYVVCFGKSYSTYNEIVGALECCKLEFYRKMVSPLEDEKCKINGEVYI